MTGLYVHLRLSSTQIAQLVGMPAHTVRGRLHARGVPVRTRGRCNREDRILIPQADLADLYVRSGLPTGEIGRMFGVSGRVVLLSAHDAGLPVRMEGAPPGRGPAEIELIEALYADTMVREVRTQCHLAKVDHVPMECLAGVCLHGRCRAGMIGVYGTGWVGGWRPSERLDLAGRAGICGAQGCRR